MTSQVRAKRIVKFTLLIVGEGDSEVAFIRHLKAVYGTEAGRFVQVRNAKGKGAHHVLAYAIRCQQQTPHDRVVILIDNDAHWDEKDRAKAVAKKIKVVESSPCMEAVLLHIHGIVREGTTIEFKTAFQDKFGCEAHEPDYLERHFGRDVLDQARANVPQLADLLNHMGIPVLRK